LSLSGIWASGSSGPNIISGLIPINDAGAYYLDALRLLSGGKYLTYVGGGRPLFASYLSAILYLVGNSLQLTLAIMNLIVAIAVFFSVINFYKKFGVLPAILFFLLIFFFTRKYVGNTVSEMLGIPFGLLSFCFFLTRDEKNYKLNSFFGYWLLSIALNIRPGALAILPLTVVWEMVKRRKEKFSSRELLSYCILPVALGFILNLILVKLFSSPDIIPFSNFAHFLYSMSRGGVGWSQILTDHPEFFHLQDPELTSAIVKIAVENIVKNPINPLLFVLKQYSLLFNPFEGKKSLFSFFNPETESLSLFIQVSLYVLLLVGIVLLVRNRKNDYSEFLLLSFAGFLASIPLATTQDFNFLRPYASTIAFIAAIPCITLTKIQIPRLQIKQNEETNKNITNSIPMMFTSVVLVLVSFILPMMFGNREGPKTYSTQPCPDGKESIVFRIYPNSSIIVLPENEFFLDWLPYFHKGRFYQNMRIFDYPELVEPLSALKAPFKLSLGINLIDHNDYYLIIKDESKFDQNGLFHICGNSIPYQFSPWTQYIAEPFLVESMEKIKL